MAQATAHPDRRLISSEDVQETDVYGLGDEAIGAIDHLLIEKISGRVAYAVMSFGGFLGLAHSHYPIPWSALKYDTALQGYRTGITEAQLKDAPAFSRRFVDGSRLGDTHSSTLRCTCLLGSINSQLESPTDDHSECCAPSDIGDNTWFASAVAANAKPITEAEKKHCAAAYHKYCGEYGLESAALRNCMSHIGRSLSNACIDACPKDVCGTRGSARNHPPYP